MMSQQFWTRGETIMHLGPPTCTVDRTIFEMWLGGL